MYVYGSSTFQHTLGAHAGHTRQYDEITHAVSLGTTGIQNTAMRFTVSAICIPIWLIKLAVQTGCNEITCVDGVNVLALLLKLMKAICGHM